jgi:TRAP-type mannitol/chloroaromatic compound transport system permease small subunit
LLLLEPGMASRLLQAERILNRFSEAIGNFSAVLLLLLIANVFYDVVMRYLFNDVSIGMQELEWHLYSMVFLFGVAYTLRADGHVRVDVIYERLSVKKRAVIDILGTLLFLWPFCLLVAGYGIGFAYEAYDIGETSGDPGGLPHRWIIKSMISISFICVLISSVGFMVRALNEYLGLREAHQYDAFHS